MSSWFREAATSPATGRLSSSRLIALVAGLTLSFSTALLSVGSFWHPDMISAVMALGPTLGALAGVNYAANRMTGGSVKNDAK